ncbi:thioredoxin (plasmid) [Leptolyngbya sp. NIES-3755]|nr:thioredoxin [Leptolyngbya sp. NIES-3755]
MTKRQIEIFTAGCPLCDETVRAVRELACPNCEVSTHNLQAEPDKIQQYGLTGVPAIAVNGTLVLTGKPSKEQLQAVGIGQSLN